MHTCVCLCIFGLKLLLGRWLHLENKGMLLSVVSFKDSTRQDSAARPSRDIAEVISVLHLWKCRPRHFNR